MKTLQYTSSLMFASALLCATHAIDAKPHYEPTWESLNQAPVPEWLKDAKFGIYTHWGLYSVPAYKTNTYGADMYFSKEHDAKDKQIRAYHEKTYGPIEEFGYKDFLPMFTTPKFDAAEWVRVMKDGGVKYAGIHVVHHDGYCLWDSAYTKFDSMDTGPKRDIFGEIAAEVRKADINLVATFHHARTYGFGFDDADSYSPEERAKLDIFDPELDYMYRNPETVTIEEFGNEWHSKIEEVIEKYQPDLIWFDGLNAAKQKGIMDEDRLLRCFADYYNQGTDYTDEPFIFNKLPSSLKWNFPVGFGYRTYENARDMELDPRGDWNIDRAIGYPWTYVENKKYKFDHNHHIRSLIDIVSRGGSFLLSLTPKGDGSIPQAEKDIMAGMGRWLRINGDAIYNTRPWKIAGEGYGPEVLRVEKKKMTGKLGHTWLYEKLLKAQGDAVRFTKNGNTLYATVMGEPKSGSITIKTLAKGNVEKHGKGIQSVRMLGTDTTIKWSQTAEGLTLQFPDTLPGENCYSFAIEVNGTLDDSPRVTVDDGEPRLGDWPIFKTTLL